eukprot:3306044-Karenia_brevis.AAC.1
MATILAELHTQPSGHRVIAGDFNADIADIPSLQEVVEDGSFIDVGATPCFNNQTCVPTCFPPNHVRPSRRDYVFISSDFVPFVKSFDVQHDDLIPVHSYLQLKISYPHDVPTKTVLIQPPSFHEHFLNIVRKMYDGPVNQMPTNKNVDEAKAKLHSHFDSALYSGLSDLAKAAGAELPSSK